MLTRFSSETALSDLERLMADVRSHAEVQSMMVLGADANAADSAELDALVRRSPIPVFGGIFPQVLADGHAHERGWVVVGLPVRAEIRSIHGLSDPEADFEAQIEQAFDGIDLAPTAVVFVDGLASRIASLVDGLFNVFGTSTNFVGGGAGSLSFVQRPCVFSHEGLHQNAAVVVMLPLVSRLAVGHGWTTVVPDLQVTRVNRNVIESLDWRNAFEVYQQLVNAHSPVPIAAENFFAVAQAFPFGIHKMGGEKVVRDPITVTPEGYLVCVGELSEGDFVDLLSASSDQLIDAAQQTAARTYAQQGAAQASATFFVDCISRALFLRERFDDEVSAVRSQASDKPLFGALVLGEIANSGSGYLEFYNKTAVVVAM